MFTIQVVEKFGILIILGLVIKGSFFLRIETRSYDSWNQFIFEIIQAVQKPLQLLNGCHLAQEIDRDLNTD